MSKLIVKSRALVKNGTHILLCFHKAEHFFFLPGGTLESNENALQCLAREFHEELGIIAEIGPLAGCVECHWENHAGHFQEINLLFWVKNAEEILNNSIHSKEMHLSFERVAIAKLSTIKILPLQSIDFMQLPLYGAGGV